MERVNGSVASRQPSAMSAPLRRPVAAVAVGSAMVVALLGVAYSGDRAAGPVDRGVQSAVDGALPPARTVALLVDILGAPPVVGVLAVVLAAICAVTGRRRLAVVAIAGPVLTGVATTVLLKPAVGRTIYNGHLAYPSGHTAAVTALALVLALLAVDLFRTGRPAAVAAVVGTATAAGATMAWAQITLGAHYPTDTLGGFCCALAIVPGTAYLVDRAAERRAGAVRHGRR